MRDLFDIFEKQLPPWFKTPAPRLLTMMAKAMPNYEKVFQMVSQGPCPIFSPIGALLLIVGVHQQLIRRSDRIGYGSYELTTEPMELVSASH
jgi:hypothetical protein